MPQEHSKRIGAVLGYWFGYLFTVLLVVLGITLVGALLYYLGMSEPILSIVMAVLIGVPVFSFGLNAIAGFGVPLKDACWASVIGHTYPILAAVFLGMIFWKHVEIGMLLTVITAVVFQSFVYRILIRAKGGTLPKGKAYLLALVTTLSDSLISSPLVGLILRWVQPR
jgi:hypothetical protein